MSNLINDTITNNGLIFDAPFHASYFGFMDYIAFVTMLLISTAIGVYFGFWHKSENTTIEYLHGGKRMSLMPVTISLVASQMSCIGIITVPVEIYIYGINWYFGVLACVFVVLILGWLIMPVLYENNMTNCYEYLELRFNRATRQILTVIFLLGYLVTVPIIMFLPSLALSQVTGINVHLINGIVGGICIFYTMFGGIKAVVWTDVVQGAIMFIALLLVIAFGVAKVGGLSEVLRLAAKGHRLDINYTFDITTRATLWNCFVHGLLLWTTHLGLNQVCVQRIVSLPTLNDMKKSLVIFGFIFAIVMSFNIFTGIVIYSYYANCDPLTARYITKLDKLVPYYVQEVLGHLPGMPGLFVASVFSASLSTISAGLNSTAGVIYFDYIKPYIKHTEARANCIMKFLIFIIGIYGIINGLIVDKVDSIFRSMYTIHGSLVGTIFAIFLIGVLMPSIHGKAIFCSIIISVPCMLIIMSGAANRIEISLLPTSVEDCTKVNQSLSTNISRYTLDGFNGINTKTFSIFDISPNWYSTLNVIIFLIVAVICSYVLPTKKKCDQNLLAPIVRSFVQYKKAPSNDMDFH